MPARVPDGNDKFAHSLSLGVVGNVGPAGSVDIIPRSSHGLDLFSAGSFLGLVVLEGCDRINACSLAPASWLNLGRYLHRSSDVG